MPKNPPFSLALVTGASSGIGWAISHLLAEQKIPLILSGRDASRLEVLKKELSSKVQVTVVIADLSLTDERQKIIDVIHQNAPDLVINNAGYGLYGDALTYDTKDQLDILTVNTNAVLEVTLETARTLISASKKGVILNVASVAAFEVMPGLAIYAAAKSCVVQFSQSLDFETESKGVRVLVSCPGAVDTDFIRRASAEASESQGNSMSAQFAAEQIWKQLILRKRVYIFNWKYRLAHFISHYIFPKTWSALIIYKNIYKRIDFRSFIGINKH